jgi:hypothetical protein
MMIWWSIIQHYAPNNQCKTPLPNLNECWELVKTQLREEMKNNWLHTREMKKSIESTC